MPPDIQPLFNQDSNNLAGFVQISARFFDPNVYRVFILMDGEKYSEIYDFDEPISGIQTGDFANGRHSFKIVRIENDGSVICSQPYDVNFSNEISSITADSGYSPDKGYCFYAFGSVGGNYNVEIKDLINDNVVYTSDFNDNINLKTPASVFTDAYHIYSVVIKRRQSGESSFAAVMETNQPAFVLTATDDNTTEIVNRIMAREFNPDVIDANVKMAVSVGDKTIQGLAMLNGSLVAVITAAVNQNLNPQYLPYKDCTWQNLSCLLKNYLNVTYWYHVSHGYPDIEVPRGSGHYVQRTNVQIKEGFWNEEGRLFSKLRKDYGRVFLPITSGLENMSICPSIAELGFEENPKLEYIRMNTCYSAKYPDFAVTAGIISGDPYYDPLGDRIYLGWKGSVPAGVKEEVEFDANCYSNFEIAWFKHRAEGYSVKAAVDQDH